MKSTIQTIALSSSILLIVSCGDSDSNSSIGVVITDPVPVAPPAPGNGVAGSAVKGIIDGATITVQMPPVSLLRSRLPLQPDLMVATLQPSTAQR
ncbi:MAG: hypothetical protein ACJAR0_002037 [Candidatus Azotimanducaceae bacterium]|jgi:hypothetical protein